MSGEKRRDIPWGQVLAILMDLVVPVLGYYLLRAFGVEPVLALVIAALPTAIFLIGKAIVNRKFDALGLFVLVLLIVGVGVSFITGSPRFLLAKSGWVTAVIGIGFLVTLFFRRPLSYTLAKAMLSKAAKFRTHTWDEQWERDPAFRKPWRVTTVMWGLGMLADAVLRVVMAYTLPVDAVPGLGAGLWAVTFIALQIAQHHYFVRAGVWAAVMEPEQKSQRKTEQLGEKR